ncbi:MAG: metallophosphoesterase [Moheibacter sp.]
MNYLLIGDIHGCYYTLQKMLNRYWQIDSENLIILGDFVNKGKHTFAVLEFLMNLQKKYKEKVIILKGNNEYLFEEYCRNSITFKLKQKFENYNLNYIQTLDWIDKLPHFWETDTFFASHAGIPITKNIPVLEKDVDLLFNRKPLQDIGKHQFLGHIIVSNPTFDKNARAWYLDTGAGNGKSLSAIRINDSAQVLKTISLSVSKKDIVN